METKICTKCGEEKLATKEYFQPDERYKSNFFPWCRECKYAGTANWQKKNREKTNKRKRKYYNTLRGYVSTLVSCIKQRCNNKNYKQYQDYGGRGIRCCFTFEELLSWVVVNDVEPRGHDIHRIDNDEDYTLDNITFMDKGLHSSLHNHLRSQQSQIGQVL